MTVARGLATSTIQTEVKSRILSPGGQLHISDVPEPIGSDSASGA